MGMKVDENLDSPFLWHDLEKGRLRLLFVLFPASTDAATC